MSGSFDPISVFCIPFNAASISRRINVLRTLRRSCHRAFSPPVKPRKHKVLSPCVYLCIRVRIVYVTYMSCRALKDVERAKCVGMQEIIATHDFPDMWTAIAPLPRLLCRILAHPKICTAAWASDTDYHGPFFLPRAEGGVFGKQGFIQGDAAS